MSDDEIIEKADDDPLKYDLGDDWPVDVDLPGMWSRADFQGGDPDERSHAQRGRDEIPRPYTMRRLFITVPEIELLLFAVAKSVNPEATPTDATEASTVIWWSDADPVLKSLATALAEATY